MRNIFRNTVPLKRSAQYAIVMLIALMVIGLISMLEATPQDNAHLDATPTNDCAKGQHTKLSGDSEHTVIEDIVRNAMTCDRLKAIIVRVTKDGKDIYTGAMGESMTGVAATPDMHFRNGAFAFSYIGEIFAQLVDQKKLPNLDQPLSRWLPDLPHADRITIKNLLNMTSGYADYVYQPEVLDGTALDPFKQWTDDKLIHIGISQPMDFDPGTNWGYSHTNYVILGRVLEKITGKPMADIMRQYIIEPMGLNNTSSNGNTPGIPQPVLHTFSSERREILRIPSDIGFYEDATFWNPSWTTAKGAILTTNIYDMTTSMEIIGSGKLVSPDTYKLQVGNHLIGFGNKEGCKVCRQLGDDFSYGLGVVLMQKWIVQKMDFAGLGAIGGYLPSQKLAISVVTTFTADAFDVKGNNKYATASRDIFIEIGEASP